MSKAEKTHGLSQKTQGTYFKISALCFKIYGLYFLPFPYGKYTDFVPLLQGFLHRNAAFPRFEDI